MNQEMMPSRVLKMMLELHQRGYESLYLFSGMSPSGMYWRFEIGIAHNGQWPVNYTITSGSCDKYSLGADWAKNYQTTEDLTDSFIDYFGAALKDGFDKNPDYVEWFKSTVSTLEKDELLVFYEDSDEAKHEKLLHDAPGYMRYQNRDLI